MSNRKVKKNWDRWCRYYMRYEKINADVIANPGFLRAYRQVCRSQNRKIYGGMQ